MVISTIRRYARFHDFGCLRGTWGWISTWKTPKKIAGLEKLIMGFPKSLTKVKSVHGARRTNPSNITFGNGIVRNPRGTSEIHVENPQKIFWQTNQLICYGKTFGFIRIRRLSSALGVSKRHRSVQGGSPIPNWFSTYANFMDRLNCTVPWADSLTRNT